MEEKTFLKGLYTVNFIILVGLMTVFLLVGDWTAMEAYWQGELLFSLQGRWLLSGLLLVVLLCTVKMYHIQIVQGYEADTGEKEDD